jgi:hypothetical protein
LPYVLLRVVVMFPLLLVVLGVVERDRVIFVEPLCELPVPLVELYVRPVVRVLVPLPVIAVLLPEPTFDEVFEGRVLFVTPSVTSDVLVPLELTIEPLFTPPVPFEGSFVLLYPCRDSLLP